MGVTPVDLSSMKRSELQKLCKERGLKANGKNTDLQKKLQQYVGGEMMDFDRNPNLDKSSQQNRVVDCVSEPTTPQTPSVIPLEQQNKVRSSLVDDSPIVQTTSQHEIKGVEAQRITHENQTPIKTLSKEHLVSTSDSEQCLSLIPYNEPLFSKLAKEQEDNVIESKIEDADIQKLSIDSDNVIESKIEDADIQKLSTDADNMIESTIGDADIQKLSTDTDEKNAMVSKSLNPVFEQIEINKPHVTDINTNTFISPLKSSSNLTPIEPPTPPAKHIRSVETERASTNLMARLIATPILKSESRTNSLPGSHHKLIYTPKTKAGPALDKHSPFITRETKLNFEAMMQNSLQEGNRTQDTENQEDSMDICNEKPKSIVTTDVPLSNSENIAASVYEEMEKRVAQIKALPSPERKMILEINDAKSEISMVNPVMMQNSLPIQEEESCAEDTENQGDPMDICNEKPKSTVTADIPLSNIAASVYEEMEKRVAQIKALPSPERKKILGIDDEISMVTPFKNNCEASDIQTSASSANRFTQLHEKVFSKMPSIVTHYAAQKTKKVEETQSEVNRKRKDPDNEQSSFKKQKLAHSNQDNQATKTTKDIYKKTEKDKEAAKPAVKKTYDRNRTIIYNRSSMRLNSVNVKSDNQAGAQRSNKTPSRFDVQGNLKKPLSYIPHKGPIKPIIPNPEEQRKKEREELERRKQAAKNVAQPVLEKMKQRKAKENIEQKPKELQKN